MEGQLEWNNAAQDAIDILAADLQGIDASFKLFEKLKSKSDDDSKHEIVKRVCVEFTVHAQFNAERFYPVACNTIGADDLVDQAAVEHTNLMPLNETLYNTKVTVLAEYVSHPIKGEQEFICSRIKKTKTDFQALAFELKQCKQDLMAGEFV